MSIDLELCIKGSGLVGCVMGQVPCAGLTAPSSKVTGTATQYMDKVGSYQKKTNTREPGTTICTMGTEFTRMSMASTEGSGRMDKKMVMDNSCGLMVVIMKVILWKGECMGMGDMIGQMGVITKEYKR